MAVKVSKPKVNIREKLTELDIPKGVHGTQVIGSQTVGETYDLIRAGRRNLLYNGDMWVNQRGDVTGVTGNQYGGPDRWKSMIASCGTWGISQSTDVPIGQGFKKSLKLDCEANRASLAAGSNLSIAQYIEGHDLAHLRWGYPDAKDLTLSFWLKTDNGVTGTFVVYIRNHGGGTCLNRQVRVRDQGYWNKYVVNIPADRTNQFTYDHSKQLELAFHFDAGTNLGGAASGGSMLNTWLAYHAAHTAVGCDLRLASSTGNNLYITGVQLEEGSESTPYQHLTYGEELKLCERYYEVHWQNTNASNPAGSHGDGFNAVASGGISGSKAYFPIRWRTQKRAQPALSYGGKFRVSGGGSTSNVEPDEFYSPSIDGGRIRTPHSGSGSTGQATWLEYDQTNGANSGYFRVDSEL